MKHSTTFRKIICILLTISQISCTNLQPIEASPETLQERIRQGDLLKVGDSVSVFTEDEKEHRFVVTAIDADEIRGRVVNMHTDDADEIREEVVTIPIDSVVAVQTREMSIGKTALLAGGVYGIIFLIAMAIAPALILSSAGP